MKANKQLKKAKKIIKDDYSLLARLADVNTHPKKEIFLSSCFIISILLSTLGMLAGHHELSAIATCINAILGLYMHSTKIVEVTKETHNDNAKD